MSYKSILSNPALKEFEDIQRNDEFNNFMKRVGEVSNLVRDMACGDKDKSDAAKALADKYLDGKIITEENIEMVVKEDRNVINQKAFQTLEKKETGEIDKDVWMAEMAKDADRRALDRKIRREKADTLKTQATKAFRRGDYDRALSCYNRAIDQVKDNPMLYCDRALTNIKLGNFDKVCKDCDMAIRLNENSFKARLYMAKAYKELEETDKYEECRKELENMFRQHQDLIEYFLDKEKDFTDDKDDQSITKTFYYKK